MSIRAQILAGCLALTALAGLLGMHAHRSERELGALALRIYGEAFMGMSYLRSAQVGFAAIAADARADAADRAAVAAVLDDLAVARDRAMSPTGRAGAEAFIAGVRSAAARAERGDSAAAFGPVQVGFEGVVETFAGDGLRYRRAWATPRRRGSGGPGQRSGRPWPRRWPSRRCSAP